MSESGTGDKAAPGLWVGALLGLAQIAIWGGSFFLLAVLAAPIQADTGWSLTWIYGALTTGLIVSAWLSPRASTYIKQGRGRSMLMISGWLVSTGLVLVGLAPNFPLFVLGWIVIGVGMAGGLYDPLFATLGTLYGPQARYSIQSVTLFGGFASTLTWPLLAWMELAMGWRWTCVAYALLLATAIGPLYWKALPAASAVLSESQLPVGRRSTDAYGLQDVDAKLFLLLTLVFAVAAVLMSAISVQIIVLLQGSGQTAAEAIALSALLGPSMVAVRVINMSLKNLHAIWLALFSTAFVAAGLLLISISPAAAAIGIVLYGVGNGLRALVRGTLPLAMVPPQAYAEVMGRLARSSLFCQALAPLVCGFIITHWGAQTTLWVLALLAFANVLLSLVLRQHVKGMRVPEMAG